MEITPGLGLPWVYWHTVQSLSIFFTHETVGFLARDVFGDQAKIPISWQEESAIMVLARGKLSNIFFYFPVRYDFFSN